MPETLKVLALLGVLALAVALGYSYRDNAARAEIATLKAEWAKERERLTDAYAADLKKTVETERQWRADQTEVLNAAFADLNRARADRDAALGMSRRLRDEIKRRDDPLPGFIAAGAGLTFRSTPAAETGDLLGELFLGAEGAAGELAAHADEARIAGLACERAYDALTAKK